MKKGHTWIGILFTVHFLLAQSLPAQERDPIDVLHYDITLEILPDGQRLIGEAHLDIRLLDPDTPFFTLNFSGPELDSARLDSRSIQSLVSDRLLYFENSGLPDTFRLSLYYSGMPGNDGYGGFFFRDQLAFSVGQGLNTDPPSMFRFWVPSHDVPSDKATLDMRIIVPHPLQAVSNGRLLEVIELPDSRSLYHWRETHPIATYLIAVTAGLFARFDQPYVSLTGDSLTLSHYVNEASLERAQRDWSALPRMMAFFERRFAPYPFDGYGMIEVPIRGAMEHQGMTSFGSQLITGDRRYEYIVAHELAHHWWGDLVTCADWRDLWLNEGFATYSEVLYYESESGDSIRSALMRDFASQYYDENGRRGSFALYDPDYYWGATVYQKGAWILHMLRWTTGDSLFWRILSEYLETYRFASATTRDFIDIAEAVAGYDLEWFFDQWVYRPGHPELEIGWSASRLGNGNYQAGLYFEQKGGSLYHLPLEVEFITATGSIFDTVLVQSEREHFSAVLPERPVDLVVDGDNWMLFKGDIVASPSLEETAPDDYVLYPNYPNPFRPRSNADKVRIKVQVGEDRFVQPVSLMVYNILGQPVVTLYDDVMVPGVFTFDWDGRGRDGRFVSSGVYFYRLETANRILTRKMSVMRQ